MFVHDTFKLGHKAAHNTHSQTVEMGKIKQRKNVKITANTLDKKKS